MENDFEKYNKVDKTAVKINTEYYYYLRYFDKGYKYKFIKVTVLSLDKESTKKIFEDNKNDSLERQYDENKNVAVKKEDGSILFFDNLPDLYTLKEIGGKKNRKSKRNKTKRRKSSTRRKK